MKLSVEEMLLKAATVAAKAHANQKRKDGTPYISHPIRVAIRMDTKLQKVVALLHDVVEDTNLTLDDLREYGFTEEVIAAVDSMTKRPGQTYFDYINKLKKNELGREVKRKGDIPDNMEDQSSLDPDEAAFFRKRYTKALEILDEA